MTIGSRLVSSVRWAVVESVLSAVTGVLSTLTVGHLILPSELGRAGAAMAVILIIEMAAAFGIGEALVRSRTFHTTLTDSAYTGLLAMSLLGMAACWAVAFPVAWLLQDQGVGLLIAVGSLLVPMSASGVVPQAILTRKMRIDVLAKRGIVAKLTILLVGGLLAYLGFGAWSILGSTFAGSAVANLSLVRAMHRWPRLRMNFAELRGLATFGGPISLEMLIVSLTTRAFGLLFGVFHGLEALGYLQFAQRLIDEIAFLIQNFALRFGLTYFAKIERNGGSFAGAFLLGTKMITMVAAPILLGFAAVSPDALVSIIGARWLPAMNFIVVAALGWSMFIPTILVSPALRARGLQKALVTTSAASCILALLACVATANGGPLAVAMAFGARQLIALPAALWMAQRYLGISIRTYCAAFASPLGWTFAMAFAVWELHLLLGEVVPFTRLLICIGFGAALYAGPALVFERSALRSFRPLFARSP